MTDQTRLEFEQSVPVPEGCEWHIGMYCHAGTRTVHPHDDLWQVWQAAKEKYEPKECRWTDDHDTCSYDTGRGQKFCTIDGSASDNNIEYCCFCGGVVCIPDTQARSTAAGAGGL